MGIQIIGNSGALGEVGEGARKPLHVQRMPMGGNYYRYSGFTGTIGAALAANSELFQFRWTSGTKTYGLVHAVAIDGIGIVAVATAAGPLGWYMTPARAWSAAGSGGTRIATSGDNLQTETSLGATSVNDIGIATTGALTAGTKTHDANGCGQYLISVGTGAVTTYQTIPQSPVYLWDADAQGGQPLVLANQEGFTIRTSHAGPTALTYTIGFTVVWSEVTAY